jgi:CRISP-associated protein Cas1
MRAGLHPGFGALHAVSDQRDACVYDLMEEFRAHLIGGLMVYCTNRRLVRDEMFSTSAQGVRMSSAGGAALIRAYETRASGKVKSPRSGKRVTWQKLMVEQAFALASHIEGGSIYAPLNMGY